METIWSLGQTIRDYWLVHSITGALDFNSQIDWNKYLQVIAKTRLEASSPSIPEYEIIPTFKNILSFFMRCLSLFPRYRSQLSSVLIKPFKVCTCRNLWDSPRSRDSAFARSSIILVIVRGSKVCPFYLVARRLASTTRPLSSWSV